MSVRLVALCDAFRAYVEPLVGFPVAYPDPGWVGFDAPVAILNPVSSPLTSMGGSEQEWRDVLRLDVICSLAKVTPMVLRAIHALPETLADLFSAADADRYKLGGIVDYCYLTSYEFGTVDRGGADYAVGRFSFETKRHRFANDA